MKVSDVLSTSQIDILLSKGFIKPYEQDEDGNKMANYRKRYNGPTGSDVQFITKEAIEIMEEVYKLQPTRYIDFRYESNQV